MAQGGARNRSGPPKDPNSLNSANKGRVFTSLPAGGFDGDAPEFPLPEQTDREVEVWVEAWRSPQAHAWIGEKWRYRTVALWVRWSVRCEALDAGASLIGQTIRLADQIGMTPAGLIENGWTIATDVVAEPIAETPVASIRDSLTVVAGGAG